MACAARVNHVSFVEPLVLGHNTEDTEIPTTGLQTSIQINIYHIFKFPKSIVIFASLFTNGVYDLVIQLERHILSSLIFYSNGGAQRRRGCWDAKRHM